MTLIHTGGDLVESWHRGHHHGYECQVCGEDCGRIALTKLVYAFEPCTCGTPEYEHLVERLYHRACFVGLTR